MQPIQDKDFDRLFKNAFDEAEIQPSKDLWANIEHEITPKKKRLLPVYWLSAAAVLLVVGVAILIGQQQENPPAGKILANHQVKKTEPAQPVLIDSAQEINPVVKQTDRSIANVSQANGQLAKAGVKQKRVDNEAKPIITAMESQNQETVLAQVEKPENDLKSKIDEAILSPKQETVMAMVEPVQEQDDDNDDDHQNKGIRNVGDVVNFIVNKVDKRKDKIIQFHTDDDDSSVSSINIGPFKFGKKNRK